jgi:hypothetical protein
MKETYVTYHSTAWELLIETGWFTVSVESGIAKMWKRQ